MKRIFETRARMIRLLICLMFISVSMEMKGEPLYAISAKDIVKQVQNKYKKTEDIQSNLEEVFLWKLTQNQDTVRGKIYLKKENYFRIETTTQVIVTDGRQVWTYSPINNQTVIDNFRPTEEKFLPQQFIFSFSKDYRAELGGEEEIEGKKCYVLLLQPLKEHLIVKQAKVWIDKEWITRRVQYTDVNDNLTTYIFRNIQFNVKLKRELFKFESPSGTEIIDMR